MNSKIVWLTNDVQLNGQGIKYITTHSLIRALQHNDVPVHEFDFWSNAASVPDYNVPNRNCYTATPVLSLDGLQILAGARDLKPYCRAPSP